MSKSITVKLDDEADAVLSELQRETGTGSQGEVLRDALGVYRSLHEMLKDGVYRLYRVRDGKITDDSFTYCELEFPTLQRRRMEP